MHSGAQRAGFVVSKRWAIYENVTKINSPGKMMTVEDNGCHIYELPWVKDFGDVMLLRACRSKGNWIRV